MCSSIGLDNSQGSGSQLILLLSHSTDIQAREGCGTVRHDI